jgi:hypothetical protein
VRIQKCNAEAFAKKAPTSLPEALRGVLAPVLAVLEKVTEQIRVIERTLVKEMPERHPGMDVLQEVDCIGPITALTFILTIDDPKRFKSSREVGSYLGLCPRRRQSGDGDPELRITRCGDRYLRSLAFEPVSENAAPPAGRNPTCTGSTSIHTECEWKPGGVEVAPTHNASRREAIEPSGIKSTASAPNRPRATEARTARECGASSHNIA